MPELRPAAADTIAESRDDAWSEVQRLRSLNRDLISLLAQPAIGTGQMPAGVIKTLLEVLLSMLRVDLAYARVTRPGEAAIETASASGRPEIAQRAPELGAAMERWLKTETWNTPITIEDPLEGGKMRLLVGRFGLHEDSGVVAVCSHDQGFPTETEALLFRVAINQAVIGFQEAQLLQEHQRVERLALEAASLGTWDYDPLTQEMKWSDRCKELFGLPPDAKVDYRAFLAGLHPDDRERTHQAVQLALAAETGGRFKIEHRTRGAQDGLERWVSAAGRAFFDGSGRAVRFIGTVFDITERKRVEAERERAEEAQRASHRLLQDVIDNSTAIIYVKDAAGRYMLINRRFEELFHVARDVIVGKTDYDLFPKDRADAFRAFDLRVLEAGRALESEELAPQDDGLHTYISIKAPLYAEAGRAYAVCGISTDITDRKRAEQSQLFLVRASRELGTSLDYETTLQRAAELAVPTLADVCVVFTIEGDGTLRPAAVADTSPARASSVREFLSAHPPDASASGRFGRVMSSGHPECSTGTPGFLGRAVPAGSRWEPLRELERKPSIDVPLCTRGRFLGVLSLTSAGPSRRHDPADLALAEELGCRAAFAIDNAELYRKSQESIRARDEFLSVASHELKTPLTSMTMRAQQMSTLLARGSEGPRLATQLSAMLHVVNRQLQRLGLLVGELLDVSRITSGRFTLRAEEVDLAALLRDVADRFSEQAQTTGCTLSVKCEGPVVGAWDRLRLEQVVANLLTNALKYGANGPISVKACAERDKARLVVEDRGIGIANHDLARIFERFERAAPSRNFGGLGLGLYITRQIVEAHGGRIWAESQPGMGATFFVELPRGSSCAS